MRGESENRNEATKTNKPRSVYSGLRCGMIGLLPTCHRTSLEIAVGDREREGGGGGGKRDGDREREGGREGREMGTGREREGRGREERWGQGERGRGGREGREMGTGREREGREGGKRDERERYRHRLLCLRTLKWPVFSG